MTSIHQKTLSVSEYVVLLLINAADADFDIHKKEFQDIKDMNSEEQVQKMKALYDKDKTGSFSQLIREIKINKNLAMEKNAMLKEVYELLQSDGDYNDFEKSFYNFFKDM